jgi:hypothetical protein
MNVVSGVELQGVPFLVVVAALVFAVGFRRWRALFSWAKGRRDASR